MLKGGLMKGFIIGLCIGFMGVATASFFNFESRKTTIDGTTCIVVKLKDSVGVSCDWTR